LPPPTTMPIGRPTHNSFYTCAYLPDFRVIEPELLVSARASPLSFRRYAYI
jgi:hypothetical protein